MIIKDFEIIRQEDSFHDKLILRFLFDEKHLKLSAEFSMRTEKEYEDFFNKYTIEDEEGVEYVWSNLPREALISAYEYIKEKIDEENEFFDYHYTGGISSTSYSSMVIDYPIDDYPRILRTFNDSEGEEIQFRQSGEKLKYVKKDSEGEILRSGGDVVFLSDQEMIDKGLPLYDTAIVAFNSKNQSLALASDEFGADGIWVNEDYQRRGIGCEILHEFRKQFDSSRKIGQMTPLGIKAVKSYFRKYIQKK